MIAKHVTITDPVAEVIEAEIQNGRYKDVSAALNDAAWHHFIGANSPFTEYGVTPAQVEKSAQADLKAIKRDREKGALVEL
jgi:hypothetical protein